MDSKHIKVREALTPDNMKKAMAESIQDQKKVDEIYRLVVSIGAGVLGAVHALDEMRITLKEYNYRLDEVLFMNKAQDITKLLKEARSKGYSAGFDMGQAIERDSSVERDMDNIRGTDVLDQALTKISFYHAIPKKELEKTIKTKENSNV